MHRDKEKAVCSIQENQIDQQPTLFASLSWTTSLRNARKISVSFVPIQFVMYLFGSPVDYCQTCLVEAKGGP